MPENLWGCYWSAWKKSFIYQGGATRQEFWSFIIINLIVFFLIGAGSYFLLVDVMADKTSAGGMVLVWAYFIYLPLRTFVPLILLFPFLALGVRRMHDTGKSGWWFGGLMLLEIFILPMLAVLMYYVLRHFLDEVSSQQVVKGFTISASIMVAFALVWLCSKPTKIKHPISSSDSMN
ncbi:DUF805 domain-containing protein [Salmonella enterica subsp. arizonae]|uniref:DUF805 domain-containing protein n=2 Tax=Salmonella enterica TaxID=28901 RepID=A0A740VHH7_SALET|nr:DUF805 domain-containing protein [Salmonella enterica subsp. enterica]ECC2884811.1 DUF805 domain-containing protein [Salmonella enterica subsp. arizonae]ECP1424849.1 DUF805 domain-containing protein [Salmonella enterica]HAE8120701.1 DUF805 domain-containing protein [Salmonella enterica subsp. arizonae serovar 18:z4,z32:-]HAF0406384.1 DUF805 domain-containing protein [Salmonella enterica subsp. enterica serovar 6,7:c:1,5]